MSSLTIQIPLFNETIALKFSKFYFDEIGESARYIIDTQCSPETRSLVQELGIQENFFYNDKPFIENGYEAFASASPTDWIFRIDCDEVPTSEAIGFARTFADQDVGIVAFERHQVIWRENAFWRPDHDRFDPFNQRQYRLFNRCAVRFNTQIHSPGIHLDNVINAPPEACIYHLSWMFLSWEDRLKKAARYDDFGQLDFNRSNQLFDLNYEHWTKLPPSHVDAIYEKWHFLID